MASRLQSHRFEVEFAGRGIAPNDPPSSTAGENRLMPLGMAQPSRRVLPLARLKRVQNQLRPLASREEKSRTRTVEAVPESQLPETVSRQFTSKLPNERGCEAAGSFARSEDGGQRRATRERHALTVSP